MRAVVIALGCVVAGCGGGDDEPVVVDLAAALDGALEGSVEVSFSVDGAREVIVEVGDDALIVEAYAAGALIVEGVDGWFAPRPLPLGGALGLNVEADGEVTLTVWGRGPPLPALRRERSLVWTDPALLDDPDVVGLRVVLGAIASDGHGGRMLDAWFRRFASTAHSERAAPAQLMDEIAAAQGDDPAQWDLDALPFVVTAVHDRIDLAARGGACGELRVSIASVHPVYAPLHAIFLFTQPVADDDVTPAGVIHCAGTARRWARLSALDGAAWLDAARGWLDAGLRRDRFRLAETVELTVSPWEWRQWAPDDGAGDDALDNPPLFQTIDTAGLAAPGPRRDAFLAFVEDNAAGLAARTVEIPPAFRAPSAQAPPAGERPPIDLDGLDPAVLSAYPDIGRALEIVGCPRCHTEDAEFIQTSVQRTFSDFYDGELDARALRLDAMNAGGLPATPPFGPLRTD